jgi:hypothetical protein
MCDLSVIHLNARAHAMSDLNHKPYGLTLTQDVFFVYLFTLGSAGTQLKDLREFSAQKSDGIKIFVEQMNRGDKNSEELEEFDALIFFKYWNPREGRLRFIGHLVFKPTTTVKAMVEEARSRFLPTMRSNEIEALEELKPDKIENLRYTITVERDVEREAQLMDKEVELQSGDIIVIQPKEVSGTSDCVQYHYDYLRNKILVSFRAKATPEKEAFELSLHGNYDYDLVCNEVAVRLNELQLAESPPANGSKLQLWKHSHRDGPEKSPAKRRGQLLLLIISQPFLVLIISQLAYSVQYSTGDYHSTCSCTDYQSTCRQFRA